MPLKSADCNIILEADSSIKIYLYVVLHPGIREVKKIIRVVTVRPSIAIRLVKPTTGCDIRYGPDESIDNGLILYRIHFTGSMNTDHVTLVMLRVVIAGPLKVAIVIDYMDVGPLWVQSLL